MLFRSGTFRQVIYDLFARINELGLMVHLPEWGKLGRYASDKVCDLVHPSFSESFGGGGPLPCNVAHAMLLSCKPGPMWATACSCPESGGEQGSPTQCHSSGFDGSLGWVECRGTLSSCKLDGRFLGTTEAPICIVPGPVKSRATPKCLRNSVPNMTL